MEKLAIPDRSPLERLWDRLAGVRHLSFVAQSALATGWNGAGRGEVVVTSPVDAVLLFQETGFWQPEGGRALPFRNVFRWTNPGGGIRLEHLRYGPDAPVFLFDLVQQADGIWHAADPHPCRNDRYDACLTLQPDGFDLTWTITGPKKQERIVYQYGK